MPAEPLPDAAVEAGGLAVERFMSVENYDDTNHIWCQKIASVAITAALPHLSRPAQRPAEDVAGMVKELLGNVDELPLKEQQDSVERRAAATITALAAERDEARLERDKNYMEHWQKAWDAGMPWLEAVKVACDDRLTEYKHEARNAEARAKAAEAERDALAARVRGALVALKPFAELIAETPETVDRIWPDDAPHWTADKHSWGKRVTVLMIRHAALAAHVLQSDTDERQRAEALS